MEWLAPLLLRMSALGGWGPVLFVLLYVAATVVLAPAFLLSIAAGAVWGLWRGTLIVYVGAVLGASAVFLLAAPLAESRLLRWVDRHRRFAAARQAIVGQGLWIMFLLRLSPLVPFNFLNYALALGGVRYRDYLLAMFGMLPAVVMYVYYGKVVGDVALVVSGVQPPRGVAYYTLLVIGLLATVLATMLITKAARRAIEKERMISSK
jgi:uncharacterized membrane protein YdjX (TVP38/TMEM64 family)